MNKIKSAIFTAFIAFSACCFAAGFKDKVKIRQFEKNYLKSTVQQSRLDDFRQLPDAQKIAWIDQFATADGISKVNRKTDIMAIAETCLSKLQISDSLMYRLDQNLKTLRKRGYQAVLFRFDCTEDVNDLMKIQKCIIDNDMSVILAYSGHDQKTPRWNPLIDPSIISGYLEKLAPDAFAIALGWKTSSLHFRQMPYEYYNWLAAAARKYNSSILIYGEVFHGRMDVANVIKTDWIYVQNMNGYIVKNLGYHTSCIENSVIQQQQNLIPEFSDIDKIGEVVGFCPYYRSKMDAELDIETQWQFKVKIEQRFLQIGYSTLTLLNDGIDDYLTEKYCTNDNLLLNDIQ